MRTITEIIENIDTNILKTFRYGSNVVSFINSEFDKIKEDFLKKNKISDKSFDLLKEKYAEKVEKTFIMSDNAQLLCTFLINSIEEIIQKKQNLLGLKYNADFPITYGNKIGLLFNINNLLLNEYAYRGFLFESEENLNLFRIFFNNKSLPKNIIISFLTQFNAFIERLLPLLIDFFINDNSHKHNLEEKIKFQEKIDSLLSNLSKDGSLDSTRALLEDGRDYFNENLKIPREYLFKRLNNGKRLNINEDYPREEFFYYTHIFIERNDSYLKHNTFKSLYDLIHFELDLTKLKYFIDNSNPLVFHIQNNFFKKKNELPSLLKGILSKSKFFSDYLFKVKSIKGKSAKLIPLINNYIEIIDYNNFKIKSFDEILNSLCQRIQKSIPMPSDNNSLVFNLFSPSFSSEGISIKLFDLIDYILNLVDEIKKFFVNSLNLKALLKKTKHSELWNGGRGFLDIPKTLNESLKRGILTPMQTYKKKNQESPPTIFVLYDLSQSMEWISVVRSSQFLVLLLLSFFDMDIQKFIIGYITSGAKRRNIAKSLERNVSISEKQKTKFSDQLLKTIKLKWQVSLSQNLNEVVQEYNKSEIYEAYRDFLDNDIAGTTGSHADTMHLLTNHPDMNNHGLKYIFIVTDHKLEPYAKKLFCEQSAELINRLDVRYFFVWITKELWDESFDSLIEGNQRFQFPTRRMIGRKLAKELITQGIDPSNIDLSKIGDDAEIRFYKFLYDYYDQCHVVNDQNMRYIGEIKTILQKLEAQKFYIP